MSIRIATGLVQGLALYLLYSAADSRVWPATVGLIFAPLLVIAWCLPIVILASVSNMRARTLAVWSGGATLLLAGLTVHDVLRDPDRLSGAWTFWSLWVSAEDQPGRGIWPTMQLLPAIVLVLFALQTFVVAGDADRKPIASYPRLFDAVWKHAVQLALSLTFVGLFWLLLALGAALFHLIGLDFLKDLIQRRWFAMPATSLAFACAVHVTDVRAGIVRGVRTLIHVLLSWLLPLMALFTAGFLASLPFTGLDLLWNTRFATSLLVAAAFVSVLLVNAAYQDGELEQPAPWLLRQTASLACLALVPLVALAAYALSLRVQQHGWTSDRIVAAAVVVVAASFALGYAWSVFRRGAWLKGIEVTNVVTALVALGVVLALYTPLADPARISVTDQVARLAAGKIAAGEFDYAYLRFGGGRYGQAALERLRDLQAGPDAAAIRQRAEVALAQKNRWDRSANAPTAQSIAQHIGVYPAGRALPESFVQQDWSVNSPQRWMLPQCLFDGTTQCDAFLVDLEGNGAENILLIDDNAGPTRGAAFRQGKDGKWQVAGVMSGGLWCPSARDALRAGKFKVVQPALQDIDIDGFRLRLAENIPTQCP